MGAFLLVGLIAGSAGTILYINIRRKPIYDTENVVESYINQDSVIYQKIQMPYWENILFNLITKHIKYTQSPLAKNIIGKWKIEKKNFWQIVPLETLNLLEYPISVQHKKELEKRRA